MTIINWIGVIMIAGFLSGLFFSTVKMIGFKDALILWLIALSGTVFVVITVFMLSYGSKI